MMSWKAIRRYTEARMKELFRCNARWLMALGIVAVLLSATGCATTEDETLSERPWNAPKTWETGVPQSMMQGR